MKRKIIAVTLVCFLKLGFAPITIPSVNAAPNKVPTQTGH